MPTFWNWVLILSGAVLILLEVSLGGFAGFDLVLIGSAFVLGGGLGLALGNLYLGMLTAGVLCAAYILIGRRYVRSRFLEQHAGARTGTDALVGSRALVLARLAPHQAGRVRVNGEEWRAMLSPGQATPIEEGAEVVISGVDGVTLLVR